METIFGLHLASVYSAVSNVTALAQSDDSSNHTSWPEATFIAAAIVAGCSVAAIIIWQIFLTARKAIEKNQDTQIQEEQQTITQRAIASNVAAAKELAQLSQSMADLRARMTSIETILREVE
ncbi:MAG: hypothetical protein ACRDHN_20820 [Thermomicrobiales bacterium]